MAFLHGINNLRSIGLTVGGLLVGLLTGTALVYCAESSLTIALAVAIAFCVLPLLLTRHPSLTYSCFLACILLIEEFPSGYGETVERSTRTLFYSKSLGLPGLYAPDIMIWGTLIFFVLYAILHKERIAQRLDTIGIGLLIVMATIIIASFNSLLFNDALKPITIATSTATGYTINDRGLTFIVLFQFKNFFFLFSSYLAGLFYFNSENRLQNFKHLFVLFGCGNIFIGLARLAKHPDLISNQIPLFYHSPTSWLFALVIFYIVVTWATQPISTKNFWLLSILSFFMGIFILISFRRTMWFAILAASAMLFAYIPGKARLKVLVGITCIAAVTVVLLFISPAGHQILESVTNRIAQTNEKDLSTLYRLALFVYFGKHFTEIPLMGYGLLPLWNFSAALGYFRTNLENIHSLYFWILLKVGYFGCFTFLIALILILKKIIVFIKRSVNDNHRKFAFMLLLAITMFLISGFFNPVYAELRYLILLGTGLAMVSKMSEWERSSNGRRNNGSL